MWQKPYNSPCKEFTLVESNWKHFAITYKQGCLKENSRTSLVIQYIRICCQWSRHVFDLWSGGFLLLWSHWACVPQLLSLCFTAGEPQLQSPQATTTEPTSHNCWACVLQLQQSMYLEPMLCNKRSLRTPTKRSPCLLQLEKSCVQQWRPSTIKTLINY